MLYKFRTETETEKETTNLSGMAKICDIYDFITFASQLNEKIPLAFGQLKFRFGEPLYTSENLESQYEYHIVSEDENGKEYMLIVYSGSSGPSIGGKTEDKGTCDAAEALAEFIRNAEAADYTYKGYYMDAPCIVKMGVKDGTPYYEAEELNLSEAEFGELYRRLYGLDE